MPDIIATEAVSGPQPPALSATSDMPVVTPLDPAPEPAPEPIPAPVDPASEDDPPADPAVDPPIEIDGVTATKPDRTLSGRLSQRTRERNEERQRADQLAGLLEQAIGKLGTPPAAAPQADVPQAPVAPDPRPKREAFEDPDAYDSALIEWSSRQSTLLVKAELERQETARRQQDEQRQRDQEQAQHVTRTQETWNRSVEEVKADPLYADFDDVAFNPDLMIPTGMVPMVASAGPKVLYWLGQNPSEAERISKLDPLQQAFELGEIRHQVNSVKPPVSRAPAPITPVRGQNRAAEKTPDEETMEEYAARRLPTVQKERQNSMFGNRTN